MTNQKLIEAAQALKKAYDDPDNTCNPELGLYIKDVLFALDEMESESAIPPDRIHACPKCGGYTSPEAVHKCEGECTCLHAPEFETPNDDYATKMLIDPACPLHGAPERKEERCELGEDELDGEETALIRLIDAGWKVHEGLDANCTPRCGLSDKEWSVVLHEHREALIEAEKVAFVSRPAPARQGEEELPEWRLGRWTKVTTPNWNEDCRIIDQVIPGGPGITLKNIILVAGDDPDERDIRAKIIISDHVTAQRAQDRLRQAETLVRQMVKRFGFGCQYSFDPKKSACEYCKDKLDCTALAAANQWLEEDHV